MRILHVIPSLEGGGAERQLVYLANAQAGLGDDVHVAPIRAGGPNERLLHSDCTLEAVDVARAASPRAGARVLALVRRLVPDVVQTWLLHGHVWGGGAARLARVPWVLAERSSPLDFGPRAPVFFALQLACGQLADAVVANSPRGMDFWESHGRRRVGKHLIPNGLPLDELDRVVPAPAAGLPGGERPMVLWAGRMDRNKNPTLFVDALATALRDTDAWALLCGDGPERAAAQARVDPALRERIVFAGYRSDLWALMKSASVFVGTSSWEGNPNVIHEAMACRAPLVVCDVEAYRRALDAQSAVFVPSGDAEALGRAIRQALVDRPSAIARARHARRVAEGLSMEAVATRYREVYEEVLRRRHRPSVRLVG